MRQLSVALLAGIVGTALVAPLARAQSQGVSWEIVSAVPPTRDASDPRDASQPG